MQPSPAIVANHTPERAMFVERRVNNSRDTHRQIALERNESTIIQLQNLQAQLHSMFTQVTTLIKSTKETNSRLDFIDARDRRKGER